MKRVGIGVLIFIALSIGWHYFYKIYNTRLAFEYLKKFTYIPLTNSYQPAGNHEYFHPKIPRAVLLLQGHNVSPEIFKNLYPEIAKAQIPYYAPRLAGYGLGDFHLLEAVTATDWIRDSIRAYDLLASMAEKVDVIGFSMGTFLGLILAQNRPVDRLILISPGIVFNKEDLIYTKLLNAPITSFLLKFYIPVYRLPLIKGRAKGTEGFDTIDPVLARQAFTYKAEPINCEIATGNLIDYIDLAKLPKDQKLYLLYGAHDKTLDMKSSIEKFNEETHPTEIIRYENSAHDLVIDQQHQEVTRDILRILNQPK